jgi:hypothetical protein
MSEPRPRFNAEIAKLAAAEIVDSLIAQRLVGASERDECIAGIAKHAGPHDDGYTIAKAMDRYEHWDCDFQIAEVLDGFGNACDGYMRQAEKEWAARTNPQPPVPMGTRIKLSWGKSGIIDGISSYSVASYEVKVDGEPENSRYIVRFEEAVAAETETV